MTKRVCVDSCVLINVLTGGGNDNPEWYPAGRRLLAAGERGEFEIVISTLVIAEVAGNGQIRGSQLARSVRRERVSRVHAWLRSGFTTVELDEDLARRAAELAIEFQLSGADAAILASAQRVDASALYTWDEGLLKLDLSEAGLPILTPDKAVLGQTLFEAAGAPEVAR